MRSWLSNDLMRNILQKEIIRYLIVGGLNTVVTYVLYLLILNVSNITIAYTTSYILGILISYFLNVIFVFKTKVSIKKFFQFPLVYVVQYFLNTFFLIILVKNLNVNEKLAPLIILIISIPITFILTKVILGNRKFKEKPQ